MIKTSNTIRRLPSGEVTINHGINNIKRNFGVTCHSLLSQWFDIKNTIIRFFLGIMKETKSRFLLLDVNDLTTRLSNS